ncbi:hypothetical protein CIK58_11165 [Brevibacterium aurantiacum]|nr:hypothetical protein CIK58_11165 [Brevibacterium aurantiacum]
MVKCSLVGGLDRAEEERCRSVPGSRGFRIRYCDLLGQFRRAMADGASDGPTGCVEDEPQFDGFTEPSSVGEPLFDV